MLYKSTKPRRWTETTKDCLRQGCVCEGCDINDIYFKDTNGKCYAKAAVIESVRVLGKPEGINTPTVIEEEIKIG